MKIKLSKEKRIDTLHQEPHYELVIFTMFFMVFLITVPNLQNLNEYTAIYYVLPYSDFGFKSRLVIGSVISMFTYYISSKMIYIIISVITVLFIFLVSLMIGNAVRRAVKNNNDSAEILIILFIACPVSVQYLFNINNFGRFDLFSILIAAGLLYCIKNEKLKWTVPFLCLFAMIFSFNFAFMFMPVIAVIMIYEYFVVKYSKTHLLIFAVSCVAVVASLIYFKVLVPVSNFSSPEEVKLYLAGRTDVQGGEIPVFYDICYPIAKIYTRGADKAYSWFFELLKVYGPFMLFSTAPAFVLFISFWIKALKNTRQKKKKLFFGLCMLAPAGGLPMFLAIDWDRWIPIIFISQFMLVLYLTAVNDTDAVDTLKAIKRFFSRHSLLVMLAIIYLSSSIFSNNYSVYLSVMIKHIDTFYNF